MCMNEEQYFNAKCLLLMFTNLTQMGIAPALMIHSQPQSWTARTVSNILIKCVSTGIGWNVAMRHLRLLTKPVADLGVGSWPLCSVRRLPGEITVLKCGGAEKMKKLASSFLLYWQIQQTRRIWAESKWNSAGIWIFLPLSWHHWAR